AELAGVVRAVGSGVEGFAAGDRILASVPLGAFAERAAVPARGAWQMPESMSFEAGPSFPIVYPTSYVGLVFPAGLPRGETLLVVGLWSGRIPEVTLSRVLLKNTSLVGLHWGAHALHPPERMAETLAALLALYREGKVEPVVYRTYPLEELPAALEALGSRQSYGKVVVAP